MNDDETPAESDVTVGSAAAARPAWRSRLTGPRTRLGAAALALVLLGGVGGFGLSAAVGGHGGGHGDRHSQRDEADGRGKDSRKGTDRS